MPKRFTETEKWRDPWFRALPPYGKLVFLYIIDNCDAAGVWNPDKPMAEFCIGESIDWDKVQPLFEGRIEVLSTGKWYVTKFIKIQYGELSEDCHPHLKVIQLLQGYGIKVPLKYPSNRVQEEDKDKKGRGGISSEERSPEENHASKTPNQLRAEKLFRRREITPWGKPEKTAWEKNSRAINATAEEDWELLEWFYSIPENGTYRRKDLATLLNNWTAEIDRAKNYKLIGRNGHLEKVGHYSGEMLNFLRTKFPDSTIAGMKAGVDREAFR